MSLNPVIQVLDTGSAAFATLWRAWLAQFTQPQLLKLSSAYLGANLFHSSQMGGFSSRKLRDPAPRVFLAVGFLNLAHARSLGYPTSSLEPVSDIGLPDKLPEALRAAWEGREPLLDADGMVMGPRGLFEAFTGLRALSVNDDRQIAPDDEKTASEALGRFLRLRLAANGVDWLTELPALRTSCPAIEELLMGRPVQGDRLIHQLPKLAALADTTDSALWDVIAGALAT
jgi:hypothetical protein